MGGMSDVSALNLKPGDLIGGYTLISRLGAGAMGSVWRARDDGGQEYAMKILRDSLVDESDTTGDADGDANAGGEVDDSVRERLTARERLRREAMALKKVDHPGVCGIVDMELDDSVAFIVTELIEGKNLRDDVKANGRYTGDDLERLARKLIAAVKAVHAAGIVHRDIKPTNVMVSVSGPVLVDFGIAMTGGESHVTRTGLVMGTPGFIAPEIIDGAESDAMTDWWSVASVLAFAATGAPVFGTKPMMAVLERAAAGNANLSGMPAGTMAAFRAALNPDRSKRCTPDQLLQAIALDALNPHAWEDAAGDSGETEVVRPFEGAGVDNPRVLWRNEPPAPPTPTTALPATAILPSASSATSATTVLPTPGAAPTVAMPSSGAVTETIPPTTSATTVLPYAGDAAASPESTTVLPSDGGAGILDHHDPAASGEETAATAPITTAVPTVVIPPMPAHQNPRSVLSRLAGVEPDLESASADASPDDIASDRQPSRIAGTLGHTRTANDVTATAVAPPIIPATQQMTDPTSPLQPVPVPTPLPQPAPNQPFPAPFVNPADVTRSQYLTRGVLPLWLLTIPLAAFAASTPLVAAATAAATSWLLATLGYAADSQLMREARRGGERKGSDMLLGAASLPWHAVKALVATVPRALTIGAVMTALACAAAWALALPVMHVDLRLFGRVVTVPLFNDLPLSSSGLALGAGAAIGWLLCALGPRSATLRLGAGAMRGNGAGRRDATLLVIWITLTVAACVPLALSYPIDWRPLIGGILTV
ncbi:serine/threonine-protein kinase [Bifidobacterium ramosum]|uniref:non-specific serine/threonine protein kinase n=2 Tax=Bifidobacterium ramosum TaxID=1798158 RepID=A0A7K3TD48_9BIFI|nr:protein kinase [Bifidobacterium ramosum]NEG72432.1 protein kinase [Bifidobacterium ramosum]